MTRPAVPDWDPQADVKMFTAGEKVFHLVPSRANRPTDDDRKDPEKCWDFVLAATSRCGLPAIEMRLWDSVPQPLVPENVHEECEALAEVADGG